VDKRSVHVCGICVPWDFLEEFDAVVVDALLPAVVCEKRMVRVRRADHILFIKIADFDEQVVDLCQRFCNGGVSTRVSRKM
jgi:hypothetical protein